MQTNNKFKDQSCLKEAVNFISNKKGFRLIKSHGNKNDLVVNYYCEFSGKPRDTLKIGNRKKKSKKIGKNYHNSNFNIII